MASQDWFEKDFYKVLGVTKDVSDAELKKVYRKLARQFHPDSNPGDAKNFIKVFVEPVLTCHDYPSAGMKTATLAARSRRSPTM